MKNNISAKLKRLRELTKLTQGQFADKIGMKQSAYSMIENGKNGLSFEALNSIIDIFKVDANYFFKDIKVNSINDINAIITNNEIIIKNDNDSTFLFKDYNDTLNNLGDIMWMIWEQDSERLTKDQVQEVIDLDCFGIGEVLTLAANKNLSSEDIKEGMATLEKGILSNMEHVKGLLRGYIIELHALSIGAPKGSYANSSLEDLLQQILFMERDTDLLNEE